MANVRNITDLPVAESTEGLNLIVNDNGVAKQIKADQIGGGASSWSDLGEYVTSVVELDETLYFDSYEGWYYQSFVSGSPAIGNTYAVSVNDGSVQEYVLGEEFESTWYTYTDNTTGKVYNVHFGIDWVRGIALYVEEADTYDPINVKVIQPNARIITKIDDKYLPDWVSEAKDTADEAYTIANSASSKANNAMTKSNPTGKGTMSFNGTIKLTGAGMLQATRVCIRNDADDDWYQLHVNDDGTVTASVVYISS